MMLLHYMLLLVLIDRFSVLSHPQDLFLVYQVRFWTYILRSGPASTNNFFTFFFFSRNWWPWTHKHLGSCSLSHSSCWWQNIVVWSERKPDSPQLYHQQLSLSVAYWPWWWHMFLEWYVQLPGLWWWVVFVKL